MLEEALIILKWLPNITLFYLFVVLVSGLDISKVWLTITIIWDLLMYIASFMG
jgi:hypothetical protein